MTREEKYDEWLKTVEGTVGWELELSIRATNCLTKAGITTIEQLRAAPIEALMKIKGLGRKTLNELKDAASEQGFKLLEEQKRKKFLKSVGTAKCSHRNLAIMRERLINKRTLEDIGSEFNLTRERIRGIVAQLSHKIKNCKILLPFIDKEQPHDNQN